MNSLISRFQRFGRAHPHLVSATIFLGVLGCSIITWVWGVEHWLFTLNRELPYESLVFFLFVFLCIAGLVSIHNYLTLQKHNFFAESIFALSLGILTLYFSLLSWQSQHFTPLLNPEQSSDLTILMNTFFLYSIFFIAILGDILIVLQIVSHSKSINSIELPSYVLLLGKAFLTGLTLFFLLFGILSWFLVGPQDLELHRYSNNLEMLNLIVFGFILLLSFLDWVLSPIQSLTDYSPEAYLKLLKENFRPSAVRWIMPVWFVTGIFFIFLSLSNSLLWDLFSSLFPIAMFEIIFQYLFIALLFLAVIGLPVSLGSFQGVLG
ncbi:MAG: hypothetical protein ACFFBD_19715, partial [Candidatus Hodarchaeota archaeon]